MVSFPTSRFIKGFDYTYSVPSESGLIFLA